MRNHHIKITCLKNIAGENFLNMIFNILIHKIEWINKKRIYYTASIHALIFIFFKVIYLSIILLNSNTFCYDIFRCNIMFV